jgi:acyl carrier protein
MTEHVLELAAVKDEMRAKVMELARRRGVKGRPPRDDEVIPETGLLDSAGIMELVLWFETRYSISVDQADLTIENFGTIDAMAAYLQHQ